MDLMHVAGSSLETKGIARKRRRTREEVKLRIDVVETAQGRDYVTYVRPYYTLAELAQAAAGVPELPWLAMRYSFAGDQDAYWTLWYALTYELQRLARQHAWSAKVRSKEGALQFYQSQLCELLLDEQSNQPLFLALPQLYAWVLNVSDRTWERIVRERFELLKARYSVWLNVGRGMIQQKLRAQEEDEDEEARTPEKLTA